MSLSKILNSSLFEDSDIQVHDATFFQNLLLKGSLGLGNTYVEGKWDSNQIDDIIFNILSTGIYQKIAHLYNGFRLIQNQFRNNQDGNGSNKVIEEHYDLPVEFYSAFLDPYFQYTCALFDETDDLNQAQKNKMELICQKLELEEGQRVLDIGGGWGGLAKFMKENYDVRPTVVTLSKEQARHIKESTEGIEVWLNDYIDLPTLSTEPFDAISAIGIFEHIGHKNYSNFLKITSHSLKKDGKFILQTLYTPYSIPASNRWLHKHIFPNGELPPITYIENAAKGVLSAHNNSHPHFQELTPHYFPTLHAWDKKLKDSMEKGIIDIPKKMQRIWHFYFMACAGAIKAKHMRVGQFLYKN